MSHVNRKKQQEDHVPAGRAGTSLKKPGLGKDGVAVFRFGSPDGLNFLGSADIARLLEFVDRVAGNSSARALILEGGEKTVRFDLVVEADQGYR